MHFIFLHLEQKKYMVFILSQQEIIVELNNQTFLSIKKIIIKIHQIMDRLSIKRIEDHHLFFSNNDGKN